MRNRTVPPASSVAARHTVLANRRRDTGPELAVRRTLHARGFRYRVDFAPLPGLRSRPDVVFTLAKVAVFIDGCFWHMCPEHFVMPETNRDYWKPKIARNVERDRISSAQLSAAGWQVLRFWEHEDPEAVATAVAEKVRGL